MPARRKIVLLGATFAAAVAAAVAVAAAGQSSAASNSSAPQEQPLQPRINWDKPIPGGIVSSEQTARTDGRLPFAPKLPHFALHPAMVEITNARTTATGQRAVAYMYRFPPGPGFRSDGRVRVLEYKTQVTEPQLEAVAANPPGPPADFHVITVNGHGALLVQGGGVGRVQYVLNGIMYDVTGPAVTPAEAEKLAAEIRP